LGKSGIRFAGLAVVVVVGIGYFGGDAVLRWVGGLVGWMLRAVFCCGLGSETKKAIYVAVTELDSRLNVISQIER
jgi:hypothetical protein